MIDVYIRMLDEENGICIGSFNPRDVNDVVVLVKEYGASVDTKENLFAASYYSSQFVVSGEKQHFEIIVNE